jgi:hypothetical protein
MGSLLLLVRIIPMQKTANLKGMMCRCPAEHASMPHSVQM